VAREQALGEISSGVGEPHGGQLHDHRLRRKGLGPEEVAKLSARVERDPAAPLADAVPIALRLEPDRFVTPVVAFSTKATSLAAQPR